MAVLTISPSCRFVNSPYLSDTNGELRAVVPESCPVARKEGTCCVMRFGRRERAFGPGYFLEIFFCKKHEIHFTGYPPGWVPYKRVPVVLLAPDGSPIVVDNQNCTKNISISIWSFTIFRGVIEAGLGMLWPEEKQLGVETVAPDFSGVMKTQKQTLKSFTKLFGLSRFSHYKLRERVSLLFNIPIVLLESSRKKMNSGSRDPPLWKIRGELGKGILESIAASEQNFRKALILMKLAPKNSQSPR